MAIIIHNGSILRGHFVVNKKRCKLSDLNSSRGKIKNIKIKYIKIKYIKIKYIKIKYIKIKYIKIKYIKIKYMFKLYVVQFISR
jgi:hypothetical protein